MASTHDKLKRVRAPRVHITYEVETGGAQVERELPFVVGVMGDFSGNPEKPLKPLKNRSFTEIDRDNFDTVLSKIAPELHFKVEDKITNSGEMAVDLKFNSMEDFEPAKVADQVEPVKLLLETRQKLNDLMTKFDRSSDLEALLEQVLQNPDQMKKLQDELGLGGSSGESQEGGE